MPLELVLLQFFPSAGQFASRTLQPHERIYRISELEALGVVWAVRHFRHCLYRCPCTVYTDHEALKSLLNTPHPSGKLARWGMAIQELYLKIEYRPGRSYTTADTLSQYPVSRIPSDCADTQTCPLIAAVGADPPAREEEERSGAQHGEHSEYRQHSRTQCSECTTTCGPRLDGHNFVP